MCARASRESWHDRCKTLWCGLQGGVKCGAGVTEVRTFVVVVILLTAFSGCEQTDGPQLTPPTDPGDDDDDTTSLPCEDLDVGDPLVDVELSELVSTVVTVRWSAPDTDCPMIAYVEYGYPGSWNHQAEASLTAGEYSVVVVGLKPTTAYRVRAVMESEAGSWQSDALDVTTGSAPTSFPTIETTLEPDLPQAGGFLVTALMGSMFSAAILDGDGDPVWWYPFESGDQFVTRAMISHDRQWVLFINEGRVFDGDQPGENYGTEIVRIRLDGTDMETIPIPGGNHDFVELPDGTVAVVTYHDHEGGAGQGIADSIVELRPDGDVVRVWTGWEMAEEWNAPVVEGDSWGHANAIDYDLATDCYYLSLCGYNAIVTIDRATGEVVSVIGGMCSDYTSSLDPPFQFQHQFQFFDDRLLVFDNADVEGYTSYVREFVLDPQNGTMDLVWSYRTDPPIYCGVMGDMERLPNGNTLVTWSPAGLIEEVTPEGRVVRRLSSEIAATFGYTTWLESLSGEIGAEVP